MKFVMVSLLIFTAARGAVIKPNSPISQGSSRIIGGDYAVVGQFPFQAGIFLDGVALCGGSLISDTVVTTAAICIMGTTSFEVHLGTTDITDLAEPGHIVLSTQNSLMHEQSNTIFVDNDLGIIFLPSSVTGPNIVPIRLPAYSQVNETYVGQVGRASGWGLTSDDATQYSPLLKFVDLTVISDAVCKPFWAENSIHDGNFCVRTSVNASICLYDNGGPLTMTENDAEVTLVGIASFGSSAQCQLGYPKVFTRAAFYLDWFANNAPGVTIRP